MDKQRKPQARWRKAKNPDAGGRWDTPMNRYLWHRDHGQDRELWRGDVLLATAKPDGSWHVRVGTDRLDRDKRVGKAVDQQAAMERAREVVRQLEDDDAR